MKIAIIIPFKDFRDEEYFIPKEVFENSKIEVKTFSTLKGKATGKLGGEAEVDETIDNLNADDFNGIIFIGGPGAASHIENQRCLEIAREASRKTLGAICIAPLILSEAGVLKGRQATVWSSPLDKSAVKELKEKGAFYSERDIVVDKNIITASGPEAAELFAKEIIKIL